MNTKFKLGNLKGTDHMGDVIKIGSRLICRGRPKILCSSVCDPVVAVMAVVSLKAQRLSKYLFHAVRDLYSLPNIVRVIKSRRVRWAGHVARVGEGSGVHRVLVGKPEGNRPLGRHRRRWEDNIKMDLREVGGGGDWMEMAQDKDRCRALVNTVMNFRVP